MGPEVGDGRNGEPPDAVGPPAARPDGNKVEKVLEKVHITLNKNAVHGDVSAMSPGGVRIGAPAMTSRGLKEADFVKIGEFLVRAVNIALDAQTASGKKLADFIKAISEGDFAGKI